ncbi:hypothetical protein FACS1894130_05080 [Spirochaetia bacterium]|nr:hypothetical protein FACS1894130_05080 [Spirochaetia bacterium]
MLEKYAEYNALMDKFSKDMAIAIQESAEKAVKYVKTQYETSPGASPSPRKQGKSS